MIDRIEVQQRVPQTGPQCHAKELGRSWALKQTQNIPPAFFQTEQPQKAKFFRLRDL